jgi:hypothetical protein
MITKRQAEKILALFNSGDEINILLALNLIKSLDAFEDIAQYSDEYIGKVSHQKLDTMEALYTYQGIKNKASITSMLEVWDQLLVETLKTSKPIQRKTFNVLVDLLLLGAKTDETNDHEIKLVIQQTEQRFEFWLKENWSLKALSHLLPSINKANQLIEDTTELRRVYHTQRGVVAKVGLGKDEYRFFDLLDIVRKSKHKIQYTLFPVWQPDQAGLILKVDIANH